MKNYENTNNDQESHSAENQPWTPDYQKPSLKEEVLNPDDQTIDTSKNDDDFILNQNPQNSSYEDDENDVSEEDQDDDQDDDDDLDNEDFEEEGNFEEKDNDYREKKERDFF